MRQNRIRLLVLVIFLISIPNCILAGELFRETFDNQADWAPANATSCDLSSGNCNSIPNGWSFYRVDEMWPVPQYKPTIQISSQNFRGASGKAYTQWNESNNGNSGDGWGADGILTKQFDQDYQVLYARFYIKFMPGFRWGTAEENMIKIFRVNHFDRTGSAFRFFSNGNSCPSFIFDLKVGTYGYRHVSSFRCDPQETAYFCPVNEMIDERFPGSPAFTAPGQVGDGEWHCWEFYVKMNTKSGDTWLANGEMRFWQDGQLITEDLNKRLITSGEPGIGWNSVSIGGNAFNLWTPATNHGEQWYAIDDLVISTERIGQDGSSVSGDSIERVTNLRVVSAP